MPHIRIRLIHKDTQEPVIANGWSPFVTPDELKEANRQLTQRDLPWSWVPVLSTETDAAHL